MLNLAKERLTLIHQKKYAKYFFAINTKQYDWIQNTFSANAEMSTKKLPLRIRENFYDSRNNRTLKQKFRKVKLDMFCISIKEKYKRISKAAINTLLQFCTIYGANKAFHLYY